MRKRLPVPNLLTRPPRLPNLVAPIISGIVSIVVALIAGHFAIKASDAKTSVQEFLTTKLAECEQDRARLLDHARHRP